MKRREFIADFVKRREVYYRAAVQLGEMRPSEAAAGMGEAKRDAARAWRKLQGAERRAAESQANQNDAERGIGGAAYNDTMHGDSPDY